MVSVASRNGPMPLLGPSALHLHTCVLFLTSVRLLLLEFSEGKAFTFLKPGHMPSGYHNAPFSVYTFLLTGRLDEFIWLWFFLSGFQTLRAFSFF